MGRNPVPSQPQWVELINRRQIDNIREAFLLTVAYLTKSGNLREVLFHPIPAHRVAHTDINISKLKLAKNRQFQMAYGKQNCKTNYSASSTLFRTQFCKFLELWDQSFNFWFCSSVEFLWTKVVFLTEFRRSVCFDLGLCSRVNILCRHCFNLSQTMPATCLLAVEHERTNRRNVPNTADFNRTSVSEFGQTFRSDLKWNRATNFLSNSTNDNVTSSSQFGSWGSEMTREQLHEVRRVDVRWHEFGWSTELQCHCDYY